MGSEAFRANLYNYPPNQQGPMQGDAQYNPAGIKTEWAAVAVVLISGSCFLLFGRNDSKNYREPDAFPSRRPGTSPNVHSARSSKKSVAIEDGMASAPPRAAASAGPAAQAGGSAAADLAAISSRPAPPGDELVAAFYNPFAEKWHRIPEGYEAPGAMDLTAWHKKRTDPVEWARLFAEGKLSQIVPRGGLQVRYRPAWDTYEPVLIKDPHTGKTVQVSEKLPPRNVKQQCEVQF